ncbi:hypothetical protein BKA93DRAFT_751001 [Sparassis latifolia]
MSLPKVKKTYLSRNKKRGPKGKYSGSTLEYLTSKRGDWQACKSTKQTGDFYKKIAKYLLAKHGWDFTLPNDQAPAADTDITLDDPSPEEVKATFDFDGLDDAEAAHRRAIFQNLRSVSHGQLVPHHCKKIVMELNDMDHITGTCVTIMQAFTDLAPSAPHKPQDAFNQELARLTSEAVESGCTPPSDVRLRQTITKRIYEAKSPEFHVAFEKKIENEYNPLWKIGSMAPLADYLSNKFGMAVSILLVGPIAELGSALEVRSSLSSAQSERDKRAQAMVGPAADTDVNVSDDGSAPQVEASATANMEAGPSGHASSSAPVARHLLLSPRTTSSLPTSPPTSSLQDVSRDPALNFDMLPVSVPSVTSNTSPSSPAAPTVLMSLTSPTTAPVSASVVPADSDGVVLVPASVVTASAPAVNVAALFSVPKSSDTAPTSPGSATAANGVPAAPDLLHLPLKKKIYQHLVQERPWGDVWSQLLLDFVRLESLVPGVAERLGGNNKSCPTTVADWMKVAQPTRDMGIGDSRTFAMMWWAWWTSLQLSARPVGKDGRPQKNESVTIWDDLCITGPNGLLLVVLCLAWWGSAVVGGASPDEENDWCAAVEDVAWSLSKMLNSVRGPVGPVLSSAGDASGQGAVSPTHSLREKPGCKDVAVLSKSSSGKPPLKRLGLLQGAKDPRPMWPGWLWYALNE